MPIVFVWGVPDDHAVPDLVRLMRRIQVTTATVSALKISDKDVTVFFPPDLVREGLGAEIAVTVEGLLDKPERTPEVRQDLADRLAELAAEFFPESKIKVLVKKFNRDKDGFAERDPEPF